MAEVTKKNEKFKKNASFFKESVVNDTTPKNLKEPNHLILNSSFLKKEDTDYIVKGQNSYANINKQPSLVLGDNSLNVQENNYQDPQNNNYCNQGFENYQNNNYDYQNNPQCNVYDVNNYNYENNSYQAQYSNSENYNQPQQSNYPPDYNYTGYDYYNMTNQQYLDSNQNYPQPHNNIAVDQNAQYPNNNQFAGNSNEQGQIDYPANVYQNENQGNYQLNQNNQYTNPEYNNVNYDSQYNNSYYYDQSYQYGDQGYYQQYEKSPADLQADVQNHPDGQKNENEPSSNNTN